MNKIIISLLVAMILLVSVTGCDKKDNEKKYQFASETEYLDWVNAHAWVINCEFEPHYAKFDTISAALHIVYNSETFPGGILPNWYYTKEYSLKVNDAEVPFDADIDENGHINLSTNGFGGLLSNPQMKFQFSDVDGFIINKTVTRPDFPEVSIHAYNDTTYSWTVDRIFWTLEHDVNYQKLFIHTGDFSSDYFHFEETVMLPGKTRQYLRQPGAGSYEFYFFTDVYAYNIVEQNGNALIVSTVDDFVTGLYAKTWMNNTTNKYQK